jgi:hypothetical protein
MLLGWAYDDVQFIWSFMLNKLILESIVVFLSYNPSLFLIVFKSPQYFVS